MPAARGSRGPRRGRGSCPKLLCAYRGCRSKRGVKNLGKAFSAPRDAVTESQCRRRLPNGPLLRADSPAPRHVSRRSPAGAAGSPGAWAVHAHDRDVSESRSPLAGALDAAAARVRRARGVHLPRALQLAQPLEPEGQQPRHHQDPPGQPEDETEGNSDGARRRRPLAHVDHERAPRGGGEPVAFCGPEDARPGHVPLSGLADGR